MANPLYLLLFIVLIFIPTNGNNFMNVDCLRIDTEEICNDNNNVCHWISDNLSCQFLYEDDVVLGTRKIDLIFIMDHTVPDNFPDFISLMITHLYDRYNKIITTSTNNDLIDLDLRCAISPHQRILVSCKEYMSKYYIQNILDHPSKQIQESLISLTNNIDDGIELLLESNANANTDADDITVLRDQYIIPNLNNNDDPYLLCNKISELSLYRIYPMLIQWKTYIWQNNFEINCPLLQKQPQFIHHINKYNKHTSMELITYDVASKIHRNTLNPSKFSSINEDCFPYNIAAQSYGVLSSQPDIVWFFTGLVDIPTSSPTNEPTEEPTPSPTKYPTTSPTPIPTKYPTQWPTKWPTPYPTNKPTKWPTMWPTPRPVWSKSHSKEEEEEEEEVEVRPLLSEHKRRRLQSRVCTGGSTGAASDPFSGCVSMTEDRGVAQSVNTQENVENRGSAGGTADTLLGGYASLDLYDVPTRELSRYSSPYGSEEGCLIGDDDSNIFIHIGGYDSKTKMATKEIHIFDLDTNEWISNHKIPSLNTPRYLSSCILINYKIYMFGGISCFNDIYHVNNYYDSIEYLDINPMGYNKSLSELLCIKEYANDDNCYIGSIGSMDNMDDIKWMTSATSIYKPRLSGKLFIAGKYKLFYAGGYGYLYDETYYKYNNKAGALQSIEIYDIKRDKILCNEMGPRMITPRASFSGGQYNDEFGYTCYHFIGGRTGIADNFTRLPMIRSCEKMCFPTKIMDDYLDTMYDLLIPINNNPVISNDDSGDINGNLLNVFARDKYTIWVIAAIIIILFIIVCITMLIIKMAASKKILTVQNNNNNNNINVNNNAPNDLTPLLADSNNV